MLIYIEKYDIILNSINKEVVTLNNTKSILAMVFAFIVPLVGLILAIVAKKENPNDGLATAALIISIIFIIISFLSSLLITIPMLVGFMEAAA